MEPENKHSEPERKSEKRKNKASLVYFFNGNILEDFIKKQSTLLFLIFCLILIFISNRYYCSKKLTEMDNLKKELVRLKNEQIDLTARMTRTGRKVQIEELLKEKDIELTKDNTTVYQIHK